MDNQDLGFIGLGNIGGALAANLVSDGHRVSVFDVDPGKVAQLGEGGAAGAASPAAVAEAAEVTFLSLPSPAVMEAVADEWLTVAAGTGKVLVDLSTNAPATVRALGARLAASGTALVEAPLTGGAPGARARQLVFIVGGDDADAMARVVPLLDSLGRATVVVGPLGTGNVGKLVNSLLAFSSMWVTLEGMALAAKNGVDLRTLVDMLRVAGGASPYVDRRVDAIATRGRPPEFSLELAAKDAGLMVEAGREASMPMPVASALHDVLAFAKGQGLGGHDISDLVEVVEALSGVAMVLAPPVEDGA